MTNLADTLVTTAAEHGDRPGLNAAVASGACLTLIPRFDPAEALEVVARDQVSVFEGVPTMYSAMLNDGGADDADMSILRTCISGGPAMPVEVMKAFEKEFDCMVLEGYGLSETSPVASFNQPGMERKPGSIGVPVRGVEMKLVDDDSHDPAEGEVAEIAIKGDNVYPREVEEALYEHGDVAEVAVVGIPHDDLGEEVGAAVALKAGKEVSEDDLQAFAEDRLAAYKYPRRIWLVDELPEGPTGKILRREVSAPEETA